ncbi:hypothetical protein [Huintestinicola sp.]
MKPIVKKKIKGLEFRDEQLDGFHIIVGKKAGSNPKNAIVYFPGGGSRRWQLPFKSSEKNYIEETGADLLLRGGRHIIQKYNDIPMPGMMIPVYGSGLLLSDESKKRMREIDPSDIMLRWDIPDNMIKYYDIKGDMPEYILSKPHEDDYTGFPKIIMYFAEDEVFSGIAPDYEKSFKRCGVKDYQINIVPNVFHGWPVFTFIKEGRDGEQMIIGDINDYFKEIDRQKN